MPDPTYPSPRPHLHQHVIRHTPHLRWPTESVAQDPPLPHQSSGEPLRGFTKYWPLSLLLHPSHHVFCRMSSSSSCGHEDEDLGKKRPTPGDHAEDHTSTWQSSCTHTLTSPRVGTSRPLRIPCWPPSSPLAHLFAKPGPAQLSCPQSLEAQYAHTAPRGKVGHQLSGPVLGAHRLEAGPQMHCISSTHVGHLASITQPEAARKGHSLTATRKLLPGSFDICYG